MTTPFDTFLKLDRFSTVRRVSLLRTLQELLERGEVRDLCAQAQSALEADEATLDLELRWRQRTRAEHAPEAGRLAADLVRVLSGLNDALRVTTTVYGAASPRGVLAGQVRTRVFPLGLATLIRQSYAEFSVDVQLVLGRAQSEVPDALVELGLQDLVARAAEINGRFAKAIAPTRRGPTFAELRDARRAGDLALRQLVAQLLARLADPREGETCARALARVQQASDHLRHQRKRRRSRRRAEDEVEAKTKRTPGEPTREPTPEQGSATTSERERSAEGRAAPSLPAPSPRREAEVAHRAEAAATRGNDASNAPGCAIRTGRPYLRWGPHGGSAPPGAG
ncbi:MAG: hypothetical protein R3F62_17085 [Planctomycetota bacterium]